MDKECLLDYAEKAREEHAEFLKRLDSDFEFGRDRFPPDSRFFRLQSPVAEATVVDNDLWSQVPFCGSLIVPIPPSDKRSFERDYFRTSEIQDIIDFVKERGKLQFVLAGWPTEYEGLDFLDPIFKELNPPCWFGLSIEDFAKNDSVLAVAKQTLSTLAKGRFTEAFLQIWREGYFSGRRDAKFALEMLGESFVFLKVIDHPLIEDIENSMIDDPLRAMFQLSLASIFIIKPLFDTRSDLNNVGIDEIQLAREFIPRYRPSELRFPCEIGKFLVKKLTFAPSSLRSCYELLDHFDSYDLQKILQTLNDGITLNHVDVVNKSAMELSKILDDIWKDPTIPRKITAIKMGVPIMMAVAGYIAGGPVGAAGGGLLGDLGFQVADKIVATLFDSQTTGLSERMAKLRMRSYQINVYDFKKKYKGKIA